MDSHVYKVKENSWIDQCFCRGINELQRALPLQATGTDEHNHRVSTELDPQPRHDKRFDKIIAPVRQVLEGRSTDPENSRGDNHVSQDLFISRMGNDHVERVKGILNLSHANILKEQIASGHSFSELKNKDHILEKLLSQLHAITGKIKNSKCDIKQIQSHMPKINNMVNFLHQSNGCEQAALRNVKYEMAIIEKILRLNRKITPEHTLDVMSSVNHRLQTHCGIQEHTIRSLKDIIRYQDENLRSFRRQNFIAPERSKRENDILKKILGNYSSKFAETSSSVLSSLVEPIKLISTHLSKLHDHQLSFLRPARTDDSDKDLPVNISNGSPSTTMRDKIFSRWVGTIRSFDQEYEELISTLVQPISIYVKANYSNEAEKVNIEALIHRRESAKYELSEWRQVNAEKARANQVHIKKTQESSAKTRKLKREVSLRKKQLKSAQHEYYISCHSQQLERGRVMKTKIAETKIKLPAHSSNALCPHSVKAPQTLAFGVIGCGSTENYSLHSRFS